MKKGFSYKHTNMMLRSKLRIAKRALKLAEGIMEYCGGDKWERECTEKDRKEFDELCERLGRWAP